MFELTFGFFWTSFTALITFFMFSPLNETVTVNDKIVSREEFLSMIETKLFLIVFWGVGLYMLIKGFIKLFKDYQTEQYGEICYGKVTRIFKTGAEKNGVSELKAKTVIYLESSNILKEVEEIVGFENNQKYFTGDYFEAKYYNNDINFLSHADKSIIPPYIFNILNDVQCEEYHENQDGVIIVNDVEYIRKSLVENNDNKNKI